MLQSIILTYLPLLNSLFGDPTISMEFRSGTIRIRVSQNLHHSEEAFPSHSYEVITLVQFRQNLVLSVGKRRSLDKKVSRDLWQLLCMNFKWLMKKAKQLQNYSSLRGETSLITRYIDNTPVKTLGYNKLEKALRNFILGAWRGVQIGIFEGRGLIHKKAL